MAARLRIKPIGNMGNQMLQYMWALNLQRLTGGIQIFGHDIPYWEIRAPVPSDFGSNPLRLGGHFLSVDQVARLVRRGLAKDIFMVGLGFRLANYAGSDFYRDVFKADHVDVEGYGEDYVVLNVRGAEILGNVHADYHPMPFSYFDTVIESANARPVFLGQIGDDEYSRELRNRYPQAIFQASRGPLADFEILRRSHQIAVAVSTFSWLAAWLSSAKIIHYPLSGMLNPLQRPDVDLTPSDDSRYRFYHFDVWKWSGTADQMAGLGRAGKHRLLTSDEVSNLRQKACEMIRWKQAWKQAKIETRAQFRRLYS